MNKRLPESHVVYKDALKNGAVANFVDRESIRDFTHWKIVENHFPYDGIASVSHMLVPKRKIALELQFTDDERDEYLLIKRSLGKEYDVYLESPTHGRSVDDHYHLHLIQWKKDN